MSPRRNRPRGAPKRGGDDDERPVLAPNILTGAPPGWQARAVSPQRAVKTYKCPYCNQDIRPGTAHVVAWRDNEEDLRRHWHTPCWSKDARTLR